MEVELRETTDILLVGLETSFRHIFSSDPNAMEVLPPLWDRFLARQDEVPHRDKRDVYAYMRAGPNPTHVDELLYLVGAPVTEQAALPAGMVARVLPAGLFAVFQHPGHPATLQETVRHIYNVWLPASAYEHTQEADVEYFTTRDTRADQGMRVEYWVSVRKKA